MSDAVIDADKSSLLAGPKDGKGPDAPLIVQVARAHGVSPLKQLRESLALRLGSPRMSSQEYYAFGLYNPELTPAQKREFVSVASNKVLNKELTPPIIAPTCAFVGNKLLYSLMLDRLGIGTTDTQAVASNFRHAGTVPMLRDGDSIANFLRNDATYPLFGKPLYGSLSRGSVRVDSIDGDTLHLANGRTRSVTDFASEVAKQYMPGYLFQTALDPHPDMAAITGPALGSVRVVTVNEGKMPKPLYSVWKLPAPGAMSDNFWQDGSLLAHLDLDTGEALTLRRGSGIKGESLTHHPISNAPVVGQCIPMWQEIIDLSVAAHAVFPEFGVCGFDIAVTPDGPRILECNDGPSHALFQYAAGRGVLNPDFMPTLDRVKDRQKKSVAAYNAYLKDKQKKKRTRTR